LFSKGGDYGEGRKNDIFKIDKSIEVTNSTPFHYFRNSF